MRHYTVFPKHLPTCGVARYYHHDGNGNVRAITDSTGTVVERYDYDAFGKLRNTPTGVTNDRRYTAEQHDTESGYTFLQARYHDPALGRFITKDPFDGFKSDPQRLNGYIYTQNNPVNRVDPSGLRYVAFNEGDTREVEDEEGDDAKKPLDPVGCNLLLHSSLEKGRVWAYLPSNVNLEKVERFGDWGVLPTPDVPKGSTWRLVRQDPLGKATFVAVVRFVTKFLNESTQHCVLLENITGWIEDTLSVRYNSTDYNFLTGGNVGEEQVKTLIEEVGGTRVS